MNNRSRSLDILDIELNILKMEPGVRERQHKLFLKKIKSHQKRIRKQSFSMIKKTINMSSFISMSVVFRSVSKPIFLSKIQERIRTTGRQRQRHTQNNRGPTSRANGSGDPDPDPDRPLSFGLNIHTTPAAPPPLAI